MKRMEMYLHLISLTKINLKRIKDLSVGPESMKLLEGNIGTKFLDMGFGNKFLRYDTLSTGNKIKNKLVRLHKLKSFCTMKETIIKEKRHLKKEKKCLQTMHLIRG